ncbi:putative very-long-chain 3-oxoacyl-CoA reductase [Helianthus annuus]|nr:putative very-long-chain 3-oxoacyl-CoA reductase [Helianthus annuus]
MPWLIAFKGKSGFSAKHTAEQVTKGVDGHGLTAIVTGIFLQEFIWDFLFPSSGTETNT